MAIVPITKEIFGSKFFKRNNNYDFAKQDMLAPLAFHELAKAMLHVPIGFAKLKNDLLPVCLQGLQQGSNAFVSLDGQWIGKYIPFCYRFVPFKLAALDDNRQVLCCDDQSDLISDKSGEPFFGVDQHQSEAVSAILNMLAQHLRNLELTKQVCASIDELGLLTAWPISAETGSGTDNSPVPAIYRVDERAFKCLTAEKLSHAREAGALPLIFCQLLSMQHLPMLGQLVRSQPVGNDEACQEGGSEESATLFMADETTISYDDLK